MKQEILKKTLLYRAMVFTLGIGITTILLWGEPFLSLQITLVSEMASIISYYIYEYLWRRHINRKNIKKGMGVLMIKNGKDMHNWYEVIEVLEDNKIVIKVV